MEDKVVQEIEEVVYTNELYSVEKVVINDSFTYGIYNIKYGVLEATTDILPQALNSADELEKGVMTFYDSKSVIEEPTIITT